MSELTVKQTRSTIGQPERVRKIMTALGLRGINGVKTLKDNNCTRGMLNKVKHLVNVTVPAAKVKA